MTNRQRTIEKLLRHALLTALVGIFFAGNTWADRPMRGNALVDTVPAAESIATGNVTDVDQSGEYQYARIHVTDVIRGRLAGGITVIGSSKDPDLPHFSAGENVLLLLQAPNISGDYRTVKGSAGKIGFSSAQKDRILEIASEYAHGEDDKKTHYQHIKNWINAGDLPPELQAGFLWELDSRYPNTADNEWISHLLTSKNTSPIVQLWALREAGRHQMHDLEKTISSIAENGRRGARAQAVRTLGEIGDPTETDELIKHLNDGSRGVRQSAVESLRQKKSPDVANALLKHYPNEQSSLVRVAIIEAMKNLPQGEQMLNRLEREHPSRSLHLMRGGAGGGATKSDEEDPENPVTANDPEEHPAASDAYPQQQKGE